MYNDLEKDIRRFFGVYKNRTEDLMKLIPQHLRAELEEEQELLRQSVLRRLAEG